MDRKKILLEILNLESKINMLGKSPAYRENKHYLSLLQERRFGSSMISIPSPDDPSKILRIKNNSKEMREIHSKYRVIQSEFNLEIDELYNQKARLQEKLFKDT